MAEVDARIEAETLLLKLIGREEPRVEQEEIYIRTNRIPESESFEQLVEYAWWYLIGPNFHKAQQAASPIAGYLLFYSANVLPVLVELDFGGFRDGIPMS